MTRAVQFQKLTQKYFWFLVSDFDLYYIEKENAFANDKVYVQVTDFDRFIPSIALWLKSEPLYTQLNLSYFISENKTKDTLEENFAYYSRVFRRHAPELISRLDKALLPALKRFYIDLSERQHFTPEEFSKKNVYYKRVYDYIKEKDPLWT